ncbi:MAG: hypothetical protein R3C53_00810 [Pirellulaceae bacterium]
MLMSLLSRSLCVSFVVLWLAHQANAQPPTIEIIGLSRQAAQAGTTCELRFIGNRIDELETLVASTAGLHATVRRQSPRPLEEQTQSTGVFDLQIAKEMPPGLIDVRVLGRFGLSNPRRFLITSKPIQVVDGNHQNTATAAPLPVDSIALGKCLPQQVGLFHQSLAAGQRLNLVAYAEPIDSKAQLNLQLLDAQGHELSRSRASGSWPATLEHQSTNGGEVYVVVHDFLFLGGDEYPYLLEAAVTDSGQPPPTLELDELLRPQIPGSKPTGETQPQEETNRLHELPLYVAGNFSDPIFQTNFTAKAQQQLSIEVASHGLGQLTDPLLLIYKLTGEKLTDKSLIGNFDDGATLGDASARLRQLDPSIVWTAPEDGTYCAVVQDNQAGNRPRDATAFSLTIRQPQPAFELIAYRPLPTNNPAGEKPSGTLLARGATEAIRVFAKRMDGFNGAIEVSALDLPSGVTCNPMIIPAGGSETAMILYAQEDAAAWHGELKLVGRSLSEELPEIPAQPMTIVWPATPQRNAVLYRTSERLMTSLSSDDVAPLTAMLGPKGEPNVLEVAQGAKLAIPVRVARREGGKAECLLRPKHLPPKTTLPELKVPADQTEVSGELSIAADAPLGEYTFWMQNETKIRMRLNPQAQEREEAYVATLNAAIAALEQKVAVDKPDGEAAQALESQKKQLTDALAAATARVEELKKSTAEQEFTAWLPTTPLRIRIVAATPAGN